MAWHPFWSSEDPCILLEKGALTQSDVLVLLTILRGCDTLGFLKGWCKLRVQLGAAAAQHTGQAGRAARGTSIPSGVAAAHSRSSAWRRTHSLWLVSRPPLATSAHMAVRCCSCAWLAHALSLTGCVPSIGWPLQGDFTLRSSMLLASTRQQMSQYATDQAPLNLHHQHLQCILSNVHDLCHLSMLGDPASESLSGQ